ncbi:SAM-dependent methyltransferase [Ruminococcaceae bacterium OttesenSCG-928-O06]|nr:SAM-dependent methyltransferase [Ruminococcaceae bacterium OttesenSCG-928-O06]
MIQINITAARTFAIEAVNCLRAGALEDVLRHLLSANLPLMFPENPWWIKEHSIGAEANVHYIDAAGLRRTGFIDSLVGMTAIEYEKNLMAKAIYAEGYHQVEEYCSALLNQGISCDNIIGVLSDTVRWFAFSVQITQPPMPGVEYGPDNITLHEIDTVNLEDHSDDNLVRFGLFINRYLGREGSRRLDSLTLATDMGFDSVFYTQNIADFRSIVDAAFSEKPQYGNMIASLWQNFVGHLENNGRQPFDRTIYANELYMTTLAKLLCANILNESSIRDEQENLRSILNGQWFRAMGFVNLVEYDYFGWLNEAPYVDQIVELARQMQNDLAAYDYSAIATEDLFGPLVAQLADKDRRLLLGQEYTPQWLAQKVVSHAIELLPDGEFPNFVDMCCGSGVFVVETINQTITQYRIVPENCPEDLLNKLTNSVVGFDIDPLAVLLAKLNWAMAMRSFVPHAVMDLVIPIYHADSLFTSAPITTLIEGNYEEQNLRMVFDGEQVILPGFLITPANRQLFDSLIHACYETAKARARNTAEDYSRAQSETLIATLIRDTGIPIDEEQQEAIITSCHTLIPTLERLQREGRNGIWPFLLGNSYRPGLVKGQFNAIVSNPPWMAMSKLADNPYKTILVSRAERYGIKPAGSSHLHVELASVFFLNSVDKYLKENALCGIVMPDTLLNGYHHEPFRNQKFLHSDWPVDLKVNEIWELPADTFKNKAIVVFGQKVNSANPNPIAGRFVRSNVPDELREVRLLRQGRRSAWSSNPIAQDITEGVLERIPFLQGADIMPRTLVFHNATQQPNGRWFISPIPRQNDELTYLVSDAKRFKDFSLNVRNVDDQFIYDCYLSNHILPFLTCSAAKALLPMEKENGRWKVVDESGLVSYGAGAATAFQSVFRTSGESANEYFNRINYRNKLNPQIFDTIDNSKYLVMVGAGGGYTCASFVPFAQFDKAKTIIDQTIYWHIADSEEEALYIAGMLNSVALDTLVADFQPEGAMGRRHVHKLPYAITPPFDAENPAHMLVVKKTRALMSSINENLPSSETARYRAPSSSSLAVRRRKFRSFIYELPESGDYEEACREVYSV